MTIDDEGRTAAGREVVRLIPAPTSVSEQARKFLGMDLFGGDVGRTVPDDIAGWRDLIKEMLKVTRRRYGCSGRTLPRIGGSQIGRWSTRICDHSRGC